MQGYAPGGRDVVFIPVAMNYDRVLEDRILVSAAKAGERRFRAGIRTIFAFLMRNLWRKLRGRFRRFGTAAVSFGAPLSLAEFLTGAGERSTEALAGELMDRVRRIVPVLPVPLTAAALRDDPDTDIGGTEGRAASILARLEAGGAQLTLPPGGAAAAVSAGLDELVRRRIVLRDGNQLHVADHNRAVIGFYAGSILQLLEKESSGT